MAVSDRPPYFASDLLVRASLALLSYGLIVAVSLCGNVLVCKTVLSKHNRNSTNYLIANLAFSDILMTIINIPITVIDILLHDWVFGQRLCVLVPFLQAVCVYVSSFSMLTIAINRVECSNIVLSEVSDVSWTNRRVSSSTSHLIAQKICSPAVCLSRKLGLLLSFIWLLAAVHSIPFALHNQMVSMPTTTSRVVRRCRQITSQPFTELSLTLFAFLTQYLVPLVISALIYLRIGFSIARLGLQAQRNRSNSVATVANESSRKVSSRHGRESVESLRIYQKEEILLHKRRRILLLALIVSIFAFCWLPFHVYFMLKDFSLIESNEPVFLVCHWLAMSSVCYNPFVYFWLNEHFRAETRKLVMTLCKCSLFRATPNPTNSETTEAEDAVGGDCRGKSSGPSSALHQTRSEVFGDEVGACGLIPVATVTQACGRTLVTSSVCRAQHLSLHTLVSNCNQSNFSATTQLESTTNI